MRLLPGRGRHLPPGGHSLRAPVGEGPLASNEANVTGTLDMLVAAKDCGVPAVVAASSSSVYGDTPGSGVTPA